MSLVYVCGQCQAERIWEKDPLQGMAESQGSTPMKKIKTEEGEPATEIEEEIVQTKQPIITPDGKIFYPCQYCNKIFPQKMTSITHMKKCPNKNNNHFNPIGNNLNNNTEKQPAERENGIGHDGNIRDKLLQSKIKISQNITVRAAEPDSDLRKKLIDPSSVYDYDEQDEDQPEDRMLKENDEDAANNRQCKKCKELFENPLDLLRHNRSVFIKHLLVHTTGLTHECSVCKMKFRRRDHMRAHEKRHIVSV
ncbi:hypothetical protein NQ318_002261 [Aromia moschata]|uniref:C2H2-type domain-containing protein n=1 Tax=Aromia moschata TaxID=1265417 RepID=A0AAV8Z5G1_9CUCU|nr:hypothetical protein NQ318_002261 [Aromia moschata]